LFFVFCFLGKAIAKKLSMPANRLKAPPGGHGLG